MSKFKKVIILSFFFLCQFSLAQSSFDNQQVISRLLLFFSKNNYISQKITNLKLEIKSPSLNQEFWHNNNLKISWRLNLKETFSYSELIDPDNFFGFYWKIDLYSYPCGSRNCKAVFHKQITLQLFSVENNYYYEWNWPIPTDVKLNNNYVIKISLIDALKNISLKSAESPFFKIIRVPSNSKEIMKLKGFLLYFSNEIYKENPYILVTSNGFYVVNGIGLNLNNFVNKIVTVEAIKTNKKKYQYDELLIYRVW